MKKILVIILVAATILNIVVGAFLFLDIQQMELPEMTLSLEILTITSEEALLQATLSIDNPNSFSILLTNLTMITVDENGHSTQPFASSSMDRFRIISPVIFQGISAPCFLESSKKHSL